MTGSDILYSYTQTTSRIQQVTSDLTSFVTESASLISSFFGELESYMPYSQNISELPYLTQNLSEIENIKADIKNKINSIKDEIDNYLTKVQQTDVSVEDLPDLSRLISLIDDINLIEPKDIETPQTPQPEAPPDLHLNPPDLSIGQPPQLEIKRETEFPNEQIDTTLVESKLNELLNNLTSIELDLSFIVPDFSPTNYYDYIKDEVFDDINEIENIAKWLQDTLYNQELTNAGNIMDVEIESKQFDENRELEEIALKEKENAIFRETALRGWHAPDGVSVKRVTDLYAERALKESKKSDEVMNYSLKYSVDTYKQALENYYKAHNTLIGIMATMFGVEMAVTKLNYQISLKTISILLDVFRANLQARLAELEKIALHAKNIGLFINYIKAKSSKEILEMLPEEQRVAVTKITTQYLLNQINRYNLQIEAFRQQIGEQMRKIKHYMIEAQYNGVKAMMYNIKNKKLIEDIQYETEKINLTSIYNRAVARRNRNTEASVEVVRQILNSILNDYRSYINSVSEFKDVERSNLILKYEKLRAILNTIDNDINTLRQISNYYERKTRADLVTDAQSFNNSLLRTMYEVNLDAVNAMKKFTEKVVSKRSEGIIKSRYLSYEVEALLSAITSIVSLTNRVLEEA